MGRSPGIDFAWKELPERFPGFGEPERWLPLLQQHFRIVMDAADRVPVTSVDEPEAPLRLYGESLETLRLALQALDRQEDEGTLIDVGSGGGFPGMVAAAVMPPWRVVLVESLQKRATLLREIGEHLRLTNVEVMAKRAEIAGRESRLRDQGRIVTARAVAELRVLVELTAPMCRTGGVVALPKGSRLDDEFPAATGALAELQVETIERADMRPEVSATPWTLLLRKVGATPERYPRRAGAPGKRPIA